MSFDPRFPDDLSMGASGGCGWSTAVAETNAGREYRTGRWGSSLGQWVVGKNLRRRIQWEALIAFHRVMFGQATTFRFKDWTDFVTLVSEGYLTTVAGSTVLAKRYILNDVFGSPVTALRPILRPVPTTVVFNDGASVGYETGIVTGGNLVTTRWSGQFDVPVRFTEDIPDIAMLKPDAAGWKGIRLHEVRIEP